MKETLQIEVLKGKTKKTLGEPHVMRLEDYQGFPMDTKVELIKNLIPLGLMHVNELLQEEVTQLSGERYQHQPGGKEMGRHGTNPGTVKLAGQKIPIKVPRVRNHRTDREVPLLVMEKLKDEGELNNLLLKRVLHGISCRNYESAAESVPGAIGLSPSTTSRSFIQATERKLRSFNERDLSLNDFIVIWVDGKTFEQDAMIAAMGLTMDGRKMPLGIVQAGTENKKVIMEFVQGLMDRGLKTEQGLLFVVDGGKGILSAVKEVFSEKALIQRCQWHKRENVVSYLPKSEQEEIRRKLQRAYEKPTYQEAKTALFKIRDELQERNISAAKSLEEGFEETLTLHRIGVFEFLGRSLKTANCIESLFSQVERKCRKVCHWKNSSQKMRWLATCLLDMEGRLRKIAGYKHLPLLREKIKMEIGLKEMRNVA